MRIPFFKERGCPAHFFPHRARHKGAWASRPHLLPNTGETPALPFFLSPFKNLSWRSRAKTDCGPENLFCGPDFLFCAPANPFWNPENLFCGPKYLFCGADFLFCGQENTRGDADFTRSWHEIARCAPDFPRRAPPAPLDS